MDKIEAQSELEPYEEPIVEDLPLKPEETMLLGCKTPRSGSGSVSGRGCHLSHGGGGGPCRNS
jgi:hypothetical protein